MNTLVANKDVKEERDRILPHDAAGKMGLFYSRAKLTLGGALGGIATFKTAQMVFGFGDEPSLTIAALVGGALIFLCLSIRYHIE